MIAGTSGSETKLCQPSASQSKITQITDTASHWLGYSKPALKLTLAVLSAAAVWFAIGLYLRRRQRLRRLARGVYGDEVE